MITFPSGRTPSATHWQSNEGNKSFSNFQFPFSFFIISQFFILFSAFPSVFFSTKHCILCVEWMEFFKYSSFVGQEIMNIYFLTWKKNSPFLPPIFSMAIFIYFNIYGIKMLSIYFCTMETTTITFSVAVILFYSILSREEGPWKDWIKYLNMRMEELWEWGNDEERQQLFF